MIKIMNCTKTYDEIKAVDNLTLQIEDREIFGLVGTNGAGKSTLLKMIGGIIRQNEGTIQVEEEVIFENPEAKKKIFYISDDIYFPMNFTMKDMAFYYKSYYETFQMQKFQKLLQQFHLDDRRKIQTLSKGMKKQLMMLLGISANTKYLLCDETFDGLDPVMRQAMKSLLASEIMEREFTPVLASHNLRELEDICEHVGLLHAGKILLSKNLEEMKMNIHKVQCVFEKEEEVISELKREIEFIKINHQGSLNLLTVKGNRKEILNKIEKYHPIFCEMIPLTFEEIFISETEAAGYEIKNNF